MRPQLLIFCYGIFISGTLLSLAYCGRWFTSADIDIINTITMIRAVEIQAVGGLNFITPVINFFVGILTVLTWSYPFLDNTWGAILKLMLLYPVTYGVVFGFVQLFSSIAQGIGGLVRNLLPG